MRKRHLPPPPAMLSDGLQNVATMKQRPACGGALIGKQENACLSYPAGCAAVVVLCGTAPAGLAASAWAGFAAARAEVAVRAVAVRVSEAVRAGAADERWDSAGVAACRGARATAPPAHLVKRP